MSRRCPKCGQDTMPVIERGSQATARACQNSECRHVEELGTANGAHTAQAATPEAIRKATAGHGA
jgi:hypothetical protein